MASKLFGRRGTVSHKANNNLQNFIAPDTTQVSTSTISSSDYARRCKELMALAKDLRGLGAENLKFLDLPSITVIGGQSAGKSSLVEAVSGITVPRDSGTCTRCPMECNMSSSTASWSCNISLRIDYDSRSSPRETPDTIPFGSTITNPADVEIWLRRAQAAILSYPCSHEELYTKTKEELRAEDDQRPLFSKNSVVVDINDPDVTDICFIDLPGLIQNDREEVLLVVRELVVSRIESDNTLILVTLPMTEDLKNQEAARLAHNADPNGERTIAVLTKPDMLTKGNLGLRKTWTNILEGRTERLTHGYYCVRLPNDDERLQHIPNVKAEERAMEFFKSTEPWSRITDRSRFGVNNLTTFLSGLLIEKIELNLPILRQQLSDLVADYTNRLERLPPPPNNDSAAEVLLRINAFVQEYTAAVLGNGEKKLAQDCRRYYRQFSVDIRKTCPQFIPFVQSGNPLDYNQGPPAEPWDDDLPSPYSNHQSAGVIHNLVDVRRVVRSSVAWELPTYTPYSATEELVGQRTEQWREPSLRCFDNIVTTSHKFLGDLTKKHFNQFSALEEYIRQVHRHWICILLADGTFRTIIDTEINRYRVLALDTLEKVLEIESQPLFTHNKNLFIAESKKWKAHYLGRRTPYQYHDETEEYDEELTLMAKVRAYWQIAYQRIVDYVPLTIEHEFNRRLVEGLHHALLGTLVKGEDVEGRMRRLLAENPEISNKRSSLRDQLKKLNEIQRRFEQLQ
ncbi:hypothetical protein MIND_01309300 [Mycena indigotica]|uniref:Uncharacterized protein n=1 Tax=Mycena indigotica TaxID=2126181 RepID=A0A8H6RZQ9_9AGAR|nr:uncharacterized protein MIND_01309300 [Mycena indigotica]KAF7290690.1 hypothetical protein MIND_01309300 [Mycena indigotica]